MKRLFLFTFAENGKDWDVIHEPTSIQVDRCKAGSLLVYEGDYTKKKNKYGGWSMVFLIPDSVKAFLLVNNINILTHLPFKQSDYIYPINNTIH